MESFTELGLWISENESLLSGLVSLVVLAGLVLSPPGSGLRRVFRTRASAPDASDTAAPAARALPVTAETHFQCASQRPTRPAATPSK